ncbi:hypothetical protein VMUT_1745 [Vulcanisaeta moutnovskia 768-28]|uniref:PaREP2b n=1 Tax=Vulcanisaeta moutnovskia (strain 768-28) TaxID=985053 RepID=F0QUW4_VULM7|nr:hypothetical protein [Vulcanisaeta moutnovskia]ADY01946.1 hypothetical protein VMUT_1745 [Vulcanisaeta moutnovskia 768-28]
MEGLGFRRVDGGYAIRYVVRPSKAVELAKRMLGDLVIKALIEDLAQLPDAEKLRRLNELMNMRVKPRDGSMVEVAGVRMNVHVNNNGTVELRAWLRDYGDAVRILELLRKAGYDAGLRPDGGDFEIYVGMYEIEKDKELTAKVCEVLKRMHEETVSKGKEKRARAIIRAMARLNCQDPRPGPAGPK